MAGEGRKLIPAEPPCDPIRPSQEPSPLFYMHMLTSAALQLGKLRLRRNHFLWVTQPVKCCWSPDLKLGCLAPEADAFTKPWGLSRRGSALRLGERGPAPQAPPAPTASHTSQSLQYSPKVRGPLRPSASGPDCTVPALNQPSGGLRGGEVGTRERCSGDTAVTRLWPAQPWCGGNWSHLSPSEALQNGSTETLIIFSGKKPLPPFLGGQAALRTGTPTLFPTSLS